MKAIFHNTSRFLAAVGAVALVSAAAAAQERGRLQLDSLDRLAPKASETVHVDLGDGLIHLGCAFLSEDDPEEREVKQMCAGLRGVYVRGFEFNEGGRYADADVAALREQLRAPGWTRLVDVSSHDEGDETAEFYAASEAGRVQGLAVIVAGPKELTVINIVGAVDLDKLRRLGGVLNLPKIRVERKRRPTTTNKPQPRP